MKSVRWHIKNEHAKTDKLPILDELKKEEYMGHMINFCLDLPPIFSSFLELILGHISLAHTMKLTVD